MPENLGEAAGLPAGRGQGAACPPATALCLEPRQPSLRCDPASLGSHLLLFFKMF